MAKRQPFDTHLNFPPAPTRALLSTPLDGIIGGPAPRPDPPPVMEAPSSSIPEHASTEAESSPRSSDSAESPPAPQKEALSRPVPSAEFAARESTARSEPADDGKVTVKLPPELKNRLYNAIYHERATVGDYLTRAVEDLMDRLERERGAPYPQRPPSDAKFRAGRRPN